MRATLVCWYCCRGHRNGASDRLCSTCGSRRDEIHAQVRESQRAVVFYNPETGEHRTPPRADEQMPEVYAKQGFERKEIMNMGAWERESGTVHEATNFNAGNEIPTAPPARPKPSKEVVEALARDMADAFASGPFTGTEDMKDSLPDAPVL